jgi:hypothetical protein
MVAGLADRDVGDLHACAVARGAGRASAVALLLVQRLWGGPVSDGLAESLRRDAAVRAIEALAFDALADPRVAADVPFRGRRIQLAMLSLGGWRDVLSEIEPWAYDWSMVQALRLPRYLWGLYPLLRAPVWGMRKLVGTSPTP